MIIISPDRNRSLDGSSWVQAPHDSILTTQLYFPNEFRNDEDRIFNDKLIMNIRENVDGSQSVSFNFVV